MQTECYGDCIVDAHRFAVQFSWFPFRHTLSNSDCFFVETWINGVNNFYVSNRTVLINYEFTDNTSLNSVFFRYSRVLDIFGKIFKQSSVSTGELWHLVYYVIDGLSCDNLFSF